MDFNNKNLKIIVLFLVTYVLLYFLGTITPLHNWYVTFDLGMLDYLYWLIPIPGFFFMYFLVDWINDYFGENSGFSLLVPILLLVLSVPAYWVALYFYWANLHALSGLTDVRFDFYGLFLDSAFLYFILAGIAGWASRLVIEELDKKQSN